MRTLFDVIGDIFHGIQVALAFLMAMVYEVIPSLGVSIIVVTILINILVFPLTLKQTRSSRAMQEIQPEIKRLQKKYKDEPETLQKEMLALYKEKGVNPAGCLIPMLVQMPIWFALFQVLRVVGEVPNLVNLTDSSTALHQDLIEGHPGFLGIDLTVSASSIMSTDGLVAALPYFSLIVLVIVTQFVQQKMLTPSSQDQQARQMQGVMRIMPLFFGFISYSLPAGLVLYFATSNLFRIGQQQLIFKLDGRPGQSPAPPQQAEEEPKPPPKKPQGSAKKRSRRRRK